MVPTLHPGDEVLLEPVAVEKLLPGDWVVVCDVRGGFLHRYLGRCGPQVLTKGDGHLHFDPLWGPEAVRGRVVEARRGNACIYLRTPLRLRCEAGWALFHRVLGEVSKTMRRVKSWLAIVLVLVSMLAWLVPAARAAVTLTEFEVAGFDDEVELAWETASETGNSGFYVWRSESPNSGYERISVWYYDLGGEIVSGDFIPTLGDDMMGGVYEAYDRKVEPDTLYYYKLEDVPSNGAQGTLSEPASACVGTCDSGEPTSTPTPTPTQRPTATPTPTPTPGPSPTPNPYVRFWADRTELEAGDCATFQWQTDQVQAVYLDNAGVGGVGAKSFCPCEPETHVLRVTYRDGTSEDFPIALNVTGSCAQGTAPTPTPDLGPQPTPVPTSPPASRPNDPPATLPPADATPPPTPAGADADPTLAPIATDDPVLIAQLTPTADSAPPSGLDAPDALTETHRASDVTPTRPALESPLDVEEPAGSFPWMLTGGALVGLALVGVGIWYWRRSS